MAKNLKPSMKKIALETGVAESTVCRILNGQSKLYAEETCKRVMEAAARLKYRPNILVKGILSGKTRTAGVMIPPTATFMSKIIHGIHDELLAANYAMFLSWNDKEIASSDDDTELRIIHQLVDRRVDGIILRPTNDLVSGMYFNEIWERKLPLILVDRDIPEVSTDFIGTDDNASGVYIASKFIELEHHNICTFGVGITVNSFRERVNGFENSLSQDPAIKYTRIVENDLATAEEKLRNMIKQKDHPTAIFCMNDYYAVSAYRIIKEAGLRIPDDVSVFGFADIEHAELMSPPLTTMRQFPYEIGKQAAQLFLKKIESDATLPPVKLRIKPEPVFRQSLSKCNKK